MCLRERRAAMQGRQNKMEAFAGMVLLWGLGLVPCSHGQGLVTGTTAGSRAWQSWLVGLTAVVVFLCLMFVALLINRLFFSSKSSDKESSRKNNELRAVANIYDNMAMEEDETHSIQSEEEENKQTSM